MMNLLLRNLIIIGYFSQIVLAGVPYTAASMPLFSVANVGADIEAVCSYIFQGDFEKAQRSLQLCRNASDDSVRQLRKIIDDHKKFTLKREAARSNYYSQYNIQLKNSSKLNLSQSHEIPGEVLEIVAKVYAVANEYQKHSILDDLFVKQVIDRSLSRSLCLEGEGNWLGAYTDCYRHLQKIYPDNIEYLEHSQRLLKKNEILASLKDSPCEKFSDRYAGIDVNTFVKAIDMLDDGYVVRITDYRLMGQSALEQCRLLTEVISGFKSGYTDSNASEFVVDSSITLHMRAGNNLSTWNLSLELTSDRFGSNKAAVSKEKFLDVFRRILADNDNSIRLPREVLIYHFSLGAFSGLDRHTSIIWPQQVDDFLKSISGKFSGVGVSFLKEDGHWVITGLLLDTPAYRSSLRTGDIIHAVNGVETANMTAACMIKYITGIEKSSVKISIKTPGKSGTRDVTLKRASISVPSVRGWQRTALGKWLYMIDFDNLIGYVRIASFTENTADDLKAVLEKLEAKGLKGLVLDLRANPGGRVDAAVKVIDNFIEKGMIVSIRPRFGMPTYYSAQKNVRKRNYPITILIDRHTASAGEIVAGALQDEKHRRATLVGERSFGKGSVQNIKSLEGKKAKLKLTEAYYHLPSGRNVEAADIVKKHGISSWGVAPDVEIVLNPNERNKVAELMTANETLLAGGEAKSPDRLRRYSNIETISYDPQLYTAMLVLKAKMVAQRVFVR